MSRMMFDPFLGINRQAWAVAHFKNRDLPDWAYKDELIRFQTAPWYNGRERGFVFSMEARGKRAIHIAVFEHRNSDAICALRWTTDYIGINPPSMCDGETGGLAYPTNSKYDDIVKSFNYGQAAEMAEWIVAEFGHHYNTSKGSQ